MSVCSWLAERRCLNVMPCMQLEMCYFCEHEDVSHSALCHVHSSKSSGCYRHLYFNQQKNLCSQSFFSLTLFDSTFWHTSFNRIVPLLCLIDQQQKKRVIHMVCTLSWGNLSAAEVAGYHHLSPTKYMCRSWSQVLPQPSNDADKISNAIVKIYFTGKFINVAVL